MSNKKTLIFLMILLSVLLHSTLVLAIEAPYYRSLLSIDFEDTDKIDNFEDIVRINVDDNSMISDQVFKEKENNQYYIVTSLVLRDGDPGDTNYDEDKFRVNYNLVSYATKDDARDDMTGVLAIEPLDIHKIKYEFSDIADISDIRDNISNFNDNHDWDNINDASEVDDIVVNVDKTGIDTLEFVESDEDTITFFDGSRSEFENSIQLNSARVGPADFVIDYGANSFGLLKNYTGNFKIYFRVNLPANFDANKDNHITILENELEGLLGYPGDKGGYLNDKETSKKVGYSEVEFVEFDKNTREIVLERTEDLDSKKELYIGTVKLLNYDTIEPYPLPDISAQLLDDDNNVIYNNLIQNRVNYIGLEHIKEDDSFGDLSLNIESNSYSSDIPYLKIRRLSQSEHIDLGDTRRLTSLKFLKPGEDDLFWNDQSEDDPQPLNIKEPTEGWDGSVPIQAVQVRARARGNREDDFKEVTYYFVKDKEIPRVEAFNRNVGNYVENPSDGFASFGSHETVQPQLKARVQEESTLSPINKDQITARLIRLTGKNIDLETDITDNDDYDTEFNKPDAGQFLDILQYENDIITMTPYSDLEEGKYLIRITVEDEAGNNSDQLDEKEDIQFIYKLTINEAGPQFSNLQLNESLINPDGKPAVVGVDRLDLKFNVHDAKEVIYGIRKETSENPDSWKYGGVEDLKDELSDNNWEFVTGTGDLDDLKLKSQFVKRNLLDLLELGPDKRASGYYEVVMIADDIGIQAEDLTTIANTDSSQIGNIEVPPGEENTGGGDEDSNKIYATRTTVEHFRFRVDSTAPEFLEDPEDTEDPVQDYIRYVRTTQDGEELIARDSEKDQFDTIYTGTPIFEIKIKDISEINTNDIKIEIGEVLAGVISHKTALVEGDEGDNPEEDVEMKVHTIRFRPNVPLEDGDHTLKVEIADKWGNTIQSAKPNLIPTKNKAGGITIDINKDELNINESSAIEIIMPQEEDDEINIKTLKLYVNTERTTIVDGPKQVAKEDKFEVLFLPTPDNVQRILLFAKSPLPAGPQNKIIVEVEDTFGNTKQNSATFTVKEYRNGFGFGRLLINK